MYLRNDYPTLLLLTIVWTNGNASRSFHLAATFSETRLLVANYFHENKLILNMKTIRNSYFAFRNSILQDSWQHIGISKTDHKSDT